MMKKVRGLLRLLMNLPSTCNFTPSHGNFKAEDEFIGLDEDRDNEEEV